MGKAKQRNIVAVEQGAQQQNAKEVSAPKKLSADVTGAPPPCVGSEVVVISDYLDMKSAPDVDGLAHSGYLVLVRGEHLRILYVGSEATQDSGSLFGEVLRTLTDEPVGRRGWLPGAKVRDILGVSGDRGVAASRDSQPRVQPRAAVAGVQKHSASGRPPEPNPLQRDSRVPVASKTTPAIGSKTTPSIGSRSTPSTKQNGSRPAQVVLHEDAFPSLGPQKTKRGDDQFNPADRGGSSGPTPEPTPAPTQAQNPKVVNAADLIAKQRAAAAKAAASAVATGARGQRSCPICSEKYSPSGRKQTQRPCCGVELCLQCDHKSLRSGRCYFCREEAEDFPSLGLACRVASA